MRKFLVIADDTAEFRAALAYAATRARLTEGMVTLLRVLPPTDFSQWAGVRDEIEREQREEAETLLSGLSDEAAIKSGRPTEIIIAMGQAKDAIREVLNADPEIKIIVLGASSGNPGPLVNLLIREGLGTLSGTRAVPVTIVPGDLSDEAIEDLM